MLLAIDTATRFASIALYGHSGLLAEQSWRSDNNHSVEVLPAIDGLMAAQRASPADLTAIAVAKGPGSFTGLRIGMSIAKGMCLALEIPIIAIPTLDVITYAVGDPGGPVLAVLEAGRGRLCVARYHFVDGLPAQEGDVAIVKTMEWSIDADEPVLVAGEIAPDAVDRLLDCEQSDRVSFSSLAGSVRRAGYMAELAWERLDTGTVDDLDSLGPLYTHRPSSDTAAS